MNARRTIKEYGNRWHSAERMSDGTFDLFNNVTGEFLRTVNTWDEAKSHISDGRAHYQSTERRFA